MAKSQFGFCYKSGSGYRGRYTVRGRRYYTPTRRTKRLVYADLAEAQAALARGSWVPPEPRRGRRPQTGKRRRDFAYPYLDEFAERWLGKLESAGRSPNTIRSYRSNLRAHIKPVIGEVRLVDLADEHMTSIFDRMANLSPKTRINVQRCLTSMLNAAKEDGKIAAIPKMPTIERGHRKRDKRALSAKQLAAVIDHAAPDFQPIFALASWCALRYGEVAALRPSDIDMKRWTVRIERAVKRSSSGGPVEGPPKSAAGNRTVSIPTVARDLVANALKAHGGNRNDLLFSRENGWGDKGYISDRVLRAELARACEATGVEPIVFHELRHTGLTLFGQAGATLADLMYRAGHTTADTVMIYQHSTLQRDAELAERMGNNA